MLIKIVSLVVVFFNILLGVFVLLQNTKNLNNKLFSLLCFTAAVWTTSNYLTVFLSSIFWLKITYVLGMVVMMTGLLWIWTLTKVKITINKLTAISVLPLIMLITIFKNNFITSYLPSYSNIVLTGKVGVGILLYSCCYVIFAILIFKALISYLKNLQSESEKRQIKIILSGCVISILGSAITSLLLPLFSYFVFASADNILFFIFLLLVTYAITKHNLFKIRVIVYHLLILVLWISIFQVNLILFILS
jgi:hypothetical protein